MKLTAYIYRYGIVSNIVEVPEEFFNKYYTSDLPGVVFARYKKFEIRGKCYQVNIANETKYKIQKAVHFYIPGNLPTIHADLVPGLIQTILVNNLQNAEFIYKLLNVPLEGPDGKDIPVNLDLTK